jgi:hypothetical protein
MNNYFSPGTIVTLTSTPSVVVSTDATTGQADMVAPAPTPQASPAKSADGTLTYNCQFKAIYDGAGKKLAPNGARQFVGNPTTAKLIRFN